MFSHNTIYINIINLTCFIILSTNLAFIYFYILFETCLFCTFNMINIKINEIKSVFEHLPGCPQILKN